MKIEHIAIWTTDIERLREFYSEHFGAAATKRYDNTQKAFSSYFLSFASGARLEIMQKAGMDSRVGQPALGFAHFALSVGSEAKVRSLTERLRASRVQVVGEPRWTGDGYFESVVADPDGNLIEITA